MPGGACGRCHFLIIGCGAVRRWQAGPGRILIEATGIAGSCSIDHLPVFVDVGILYVLCVEPTHVQQLELARLEHVLFLLLCGCLLPVYSLILFHLE